MKIILMPVSVAKNKSPGKNTTINRHLSVWVTTCIPIPLNVLLRLRKYIALIWTFWSVTCIRLPLS